MISGKIFENRDLPSVSHETVSALLRGGTVPSWTRVEAIVLTLNTIAVQQENPQKLRLRFIELWDAADGAHGTAPRTQRRTDPDPDKPAEPLPHGGPAVSSDVHVRGPLPALSAHFVGREPLMAALDERLAESQGAPIVMHGPLGCGKTQLAIEYARLHDDEYAVVWWVDAADPERVRSSLIELANEIGAQSSSDLPRMMASIYHRLKTDNARYLLIFDAARAGIRSLIKTVGGTVLITTRDSAWAQDSVNLAVEVPDLDPTEAVQLLRSFNRRIEPDRARSLLRWGGRSPIALEHIGSILSSAPPAQDDLIEWLGTREALLTARPAPTYPLSVVDAVRAALDHLAKSDPAAAALIELLVAFGPAPVSVELLKAGGSAAAGESSKILNDPLTLARRWAPILRCGLGRLDNVQRVTVPALIRSALREILPTAGQAQARADMAAILLSADPGEPDNPAHAALHRAIAPHVATAGLTDQRTPRSYRTVLNQIRFLFLTGNYAAAVRLGEEAARTPAELRVGPLNDLLLQIEREQANALRSSGRYRQASDLTESLAEKLRSDPAYPDDHPIVLGVARSRGHDLRLAGRYSDANTHDLATQALHFDIFGQQDLRTAASRYNLGVSRRFVGRFRDAEMSDRGDFERLSDGLEIGDPRAWRSVNALAEDLYGLGRYPELLEILAPLIDRDVGAPVRSVLRARRTAAMARRRLGQVVEAVQQLGSCYHACLADLGEDRELTLAIAMSYGNALRDAGQGDTAVYHLQRAAQRYGQAMGGQNPLVDAALVNVAAARLAHGLPGNELPWVQASFDRLSLLGPGNPFALVARVVLAGVVAGAGDQRRALELSAQAYRGYVEALGAEHPDTLIAAANLATDRAVLDGPERSDGPSTDVVLAKLRLSLGPGHPVVERVAAGLRVVVDAEPPSA
jgi:tetratricopeptide (TPR) repeat protein